MSVNKVMISLKTFFAMLKMLWRKIGNFLNLKANKFVNMSPFGVFRILLTDDVCPRISCSSVFFTQKRTVGM